MKPLLALFALLICSTTAFADTKKNLIGKWSQENGVTIEFKENGDFVREAMVGDKIKKTGSEHWQLATDASGVKTVFADANKLPLISLIYTDGQPNEVWRITIKKEAAYNDKESLRLTPIDGSTLKWGGYYFRAR